MPELTIQGRTLAYEVQPDTWRSSDLTVVLIHGSGGDRNDWRPQLDGLSDRFTLIAVELPGHGSSEPPGETSVAAYAQWVAGFVEGLGLERVVVVGCSLGSAIALWLALERKPWLVGIGLVGAGARLRVHPDFLQGLERDAQTTLAKLAEFAVSPCASPAVLEAIRDGFLAAGGRLLHDDLSACDRFDVIDRVSDVSLPALIVVGEDDRLTPVKYATFLNDKISNSRMVVIPGAGHLVMLEKPDAFNDRLADFLAGRPG